LHKWIKQVSARAVVQRAQALDAPPEPDQAVPHEDELPKFLPGFDLHAGLARLMGNKRLYHKLLLDFGTNYGGIAGDIREALAAKDFNQVHSLVHNLKGLAGNLEATDVQAAAVNMEKLVKGQTGKTASDKELSRNFAELEDALDRALEAVETLGPPTEKKDFESSEDGAAMLPPELLKKTVERIQEAADTGDVMQIKSIAQELKNEYAAMEPLCHKLIQMAEDFDLEGIQKLVREWDS